MKELTLILTMASIMLGALVIVLGVITAVETYPLTSTCVSVGLGALALGAWVWNHGRTL